MKMIADFVAILVLRLFQIVSFIGLFVSISSIAIISIFLALFYGLGQITKKSIEAI